MKSYDAGPTSPPILEETIGQNFERTVATYPDGEALVDLGTDAIANRRWTYAELNTEIDLIARGLMSLGVQQGERVGVWIHRHSALETLPDRLFEDRRARRTSVGGFHRSADEVFVSVLRTRSAGRLRGLFAVA